MYNFRPARIRTISVLLLTFLYLSCFSQGWSLDKLKKKEPVFFSFGGEYPMGYRFDVIKPNSTFFSNSTYRLYNVKEVYYPLDNITISQFGAFIKVSKKRFFWKLEWYYFYTEVPSREINVSFPTYNTPNSIKQYAAATYTFNSSEIDLPIELGFYLAGASLNKAFLIFGIMPSYSDLIDGFDNQLAMNDDAMYYHLIDSYKNYNLGFTGGFGYSRLGFSMELRLTDNMIHFAAKSENTYLRHIYNLGLILSMGGTVKANVKKRIFYE